MMFKIIPSWFELPSEIIRICRQVTGMQIHRYQLWDHIPKTAAYFGNKWCPNNLKLFDSKAITLECKN